LNDTENILLCAISYTVTRKHNTFIFDEKSGFWGCWASFTLHWRGTDWYLVDFATSGNGIFVPHIKAAYKWLEENFEPQYENGTAQIIKRKNKNGKHF